MSPAPLAGRADLHIHTTHSDGACSPGDVVRSAGAVALTALAITDHDCVSAYAVARPEADRLGLTLIPGIELTAERNGREIHLLAYHLRPDDDALLAVLDRLHRDRLARSEAMVDRLRSLGLRISLPDIRQAFPRATLGRPHLADWLVRTGQARSRDDAFARYLDQGAPAFVQKPRLDFREALALLTTAGGVAALAHPPYDCRSADLETLREAGMQAVEVAGPGIPPARRERLRGWADRLELIPVAGSDFHAPDRPGRWVGAVSTDAAALERLRECARERAAL